MVTEGRTIREAINAGTYYQLRMTRDRTYAPPACESPDEVLECAQAIFEDVTPGMIFKVERIIGGSIGCYLVEECGEWKINDRGHRSAQVMP